MSQHYSLRYASHPEDVKQYDTQRLRKEFLIPNLMKKGEINIVYSLYDRFVTGGAVPTTKQLTLKPFDELKAKFFLERRELGIINVGNAGTVTVDGKAYKMKYKEALYVGRGAKKIVFKSNSKSSPRFSILILLQHTLLFQ